VAAAQTRHRIEIVAIDSASGAPVGLARVSVTAGHETAMQVNTDTAGRAMLDIMDGEQLLITVRRLGFAAYELRVPEVHHDDTVVVAMAPASIVLAPTITRAAPMMRQLQAVGFYERRRSQFGTFLDSAAIADKRPIDIVSLLRPYLKPCTMIYVDGMRLVALKDVEIGTVTAVEIYGNNTNAPPQFANPYEGLTHCGSIVIWRK
jgi:hypothetical protein